MNDHSNEIPIITIPTEPSTSSIQYELPILKTYCCQLCNGVITKDNLEDATDTADGLTCDSCCSDCYFCCENCNEYHHTDVMISIDDEYFCSYDCAQAQGYCRCDDCDSWIHQDDSYSNNHNNLICSSCNDNYYSCENCGEAVHSDNVHHSESTDCNYCESCWEGDENTIIKPYSYRPKEHHFSKMA